MIRYQLENNGDSIKILVISNVNGVTDSLIDGMDVPNANIIARDFEGDVDALSKQVARLFKDRKFDYIVVIPDDVIEAGINLNKIEGARSVVCKFEADAEAAAAHKANIVIMDDPDSRIFNDLMGSLLKGHSGSSSRREPDSRQASIFGGFKKPQPQQKETKRVHEEKAEEKDVDKEERQQQAPRAGKRKGGLGGMLKDYLGIMD
ncbi:MAG: hypothetical protein KGH72_00140 [Candidatus Micrarchaeota archaeon]|nr:hypothetical protein [Candidatus Micrarchaeota archaeon]